MRPDAADAGAWGVVEAGWALPVLPAIDVVAARSLSDLLRLVSSGRRILAGGTDLLVGASHEGADPGPLVWAGSVPEMRRIRPEGAWIVVGAAAPMGRVVGSEDVRRGAPAVAEAARLVGSVQIRNVATLAGNLCNASPAADTVPAMCVHDAVVEARTSDGRTRTAPISSIPKAPGLTTLGKDEVVVSLSIVPLGAGEGSAYLRFTSRNSMDLAFAGVAVRVGLEPASRIIRSASIALGAVAPTVVMAEEAAAGLVGRHASEDSFLEAGRAAAAVADPISDLRASAGYRRRLVEVLVADALVRAGGRAVREPAAAGGPAR
jgi:CO/xanthine dehydrogenase FAD-binding subunit